MEWFRILTRLLDMARGKQMTRGGGDPVTERKECDSLLTTLERLVEGRLRNMSSLGMVRPGDVVGDSFSTEVMVIRPHYKH